MGIPEQREGVKHLTDLRFGSHSKWQRSAGPDAAARSFPSYARSDGSSIERALRAASARLLPAGPTPTHPSTRVTAIASSQNRRSAERKRRSERARMPSWWRRARSSRSRSARCGQRWPKRRDRGECPHIENRMAINGTTVNNFCPAWILANDRRAADSRAPGHLISRAATLAGTRGFRQHFHARLDSPNAGARPCYSSALNIEQTRSSRFTYERTRAPELKYSSTGDPTRRLEPREGRPQRNPVERDADSSCRSRVR
jgi:hypothetical protein